MVEGPVASSHKRRRIFQVALSLIVMAVIFFYALPQFTDFSRVWAVLRDMTWIELTTLTFFALWNIATYWFVMVASLPGSNYWQALKVNQTSTAVSNTVPGGGAIAIGVTYAMYSAYGFSRSEVGLSVLLSGLWNNFAKLTLPIVALALLAVQGDAGGGRTAAAFAGLAGLIAALVIFTLMLRSDDFARRLGDRLGRIVAFFRRLLRRPRDADWGESLAAFRRDAIQLLERRWIQLTAATLVSHLSLYLVLLLALRHVGISDSQVGWAEVLAAFSFARLVTALPITPGGVGVVELVLTAALVSAGGPRAPVVAAVLVYRILTYVLPIAFGLVAYVRWTRGAQARKLRAEERRRAALEGVDDSVAPLLEEPT